VDILEVNRDKVKERTLKFFNDEMAATVFINKYSKDKLETPQDVVKRLSKAFAEAENEYKMGRRFEEKVGQLTEYGQLRFGMSRNDAEYHWSEMLGGLNRILPGGSGMQNIGAYSNCSISNCFFNGIVQDSIEDIFNKGQAIAQVGKRRGGVSLDLSDIRPASSVINNSAKESSGVVSWMEFYDGIAKQIGQNGRRLAMMISIRCDHPDIVSFIKAKDDKTRITNANISVKITQDFMLCVQNDLPYELVWRGESGGKEQEYTTTIKNARELWDIIVDQNWKSAEPGMLFWDIIRDNDAGSCYEGLEPQGTNACSELPLAENQSCILACVNVASVVEDKDKFTTGNLSDVEKQRLYQLFYDCTVMGDCMVTIENIHILNIQNKLFTDTFEYKMWSEIRKKLLAGRKIGCEVTGMADLVAFKNRNYYDIEFLREVFQIKLEAEMDASTDMAILAGSFPRWDVKLEYKELEFYTNNWFKNLEKKCPLKMHRMCHNGRRNITISTIGPCGTLSIIMRCSSGIEPVFKPYYTRRVTALPGEEVSFTDATGKQFREYTVVHPGLQDFVFAGRCEGKTIEECYKLSPYYKNTAEEIPPMFRVNVQAAIQEYIWASISSTVNLPESATREDISNIYLMAYSMGCHGITVYRSGSRDGILIEKKEGQFSYHKAPKRPKRLRAMLHLVKAEGALYAVIIGLYEGFPYELFAINAQYLGLFECEGEIVKEKKGVYNFESNRIKINHIGGYNSDLERALVLSTSMLLRTGAEIPYVIKTIKKINDNIVSFSSAICRVLGKYTREIARGEKCPECDHELRKDGMSCMKCDNCGYSRCT
jgi:ribonucleoside-diphosphate reductase alpha chain